MKEFLAVQRTSCSKSAWWIFGLLFLLPCLGDDGDALLRAIAADPQDDSARLVYADYLDEHGKPERAEFIRLSIRIRARQREIGRLAFKSTQAGERAALQELNDKDNERLEALEKAHEKDWAPRGLRHVSWDRGFPTVDLMASDLSNKGIREGLAKLHEPCSVRVKIGNPIDSATQAIIQSFPTSSFVGSLTVDLDPETSTGWLEMAARPPRRFGFNQTDPLETFRLADSDASLAAILRSFAGVAELKIDRLEVGPQSLEALRRLESASSLKSLEFPHGPDFPWRDFVTSKSFGKLRELKVRSFHSGAWMQLGNREGGLPALEELILTGKFSQAEHWEHFFRSPDFKRLRVLVGPFPPQAEHLILSQKTELFDYSNRGERSGALIEYLEANQKRNCGEVVRALVDT